MHTDLCLAKRIREIITTFFDLDGNGNPTIPKSEDVGQLDEIEFACEVVDRIWDLVKSEKDGGPEKERCGNNASIREALLMSLDELESDGCIEEVYEMLGDVPCVRLHKKIRSVLSEPARNCDLYHTKEDAERAFLKEPCEDECGNCTIKDINNECGVNWLFAEHKKKENHDS